MRRFRFRLQTLENIKGLELNALQQQLAEKQATLRSAEQSLLAIRDALNESYNELARLRGAGRTDPAILLSLESYSMLLRDQLRAQSQRVMQLRRELEEARGLLVQKHKEKQVLEKFHERKFAQYSQYVEREQQKQLDETASNAYLQHHP